MHQSQNCLLVRLYPRKWRERYGEEFAILLQQSPPGFRDLLDILQSAMEVRLASWLEDNAMNQIQRVVPVFSWAWLLAVAAGINLCASVDDNPLVATMRAHGLFMFSWTAIEAGSLLAWAAILLGGTPLIIALWHSIGYAMRREFLVRMMAPLFAAGVLILWTAAILLWTRGQWIPVPWAVTGDWVPSPDWPSLHTRWVLGVTTLVLLMAAGIGSVVSVTQAMQLATLTKPKYRHSITYFAAVTLAGAILLMAVGTGLWGMLANQYAHAIFHARSGGLLNMTTFRSWLMSFALFAAAAAVAFRGAGQLRLRTQ